MTTAKSAQITNLDASPVVLLTPAELHGRIRTAAATIEAATGDIDAADVILMCRVPMASKVHSIRLYNDDLDSNGSPTLAADVGLYYGGNNTTGTKGAVIDADCYGTAVTTLQAANTLGVEVAFEARDIANIAKYVWEDAGLTSNPGGYADIALTVTTGAATAAAGTITMLVQYIVD